MLDMTYMVEGGERENLNLKSHNPKGHAGLKG